MKNLTIEDALKLAISALNQIPNTGVNIPGEDRFTTYNLLPSFKHIVCDFHHIKL